MEWSEPITNRTLVDIEEVRSLKERIYEVGWQGLTAEEQAAFLGDMIGTLNYITLNRIEGNTAHLASIFKALGYIVKGNFYKKDWKLEDLPVMDDFERLLWNIDDLLKHSYYMKTSLPQSLLHPGYSQMNDIEEVLLELKAATELIIEGFRHCGSFNFYSGSEVVLP